MKRKIAALMIAIPLGVVAVAKSASAADFQPRDGAPAPISVVDRNSNDRIAQNRSNQPPQRDSDRRPEVRRVWVAGRWQQTPRGRVWVPGHWENRPIARNPR